MHGIQHKTYLKTSSIMAKKSFKILPCLIVCTYIVEKNNFMCNGSITLCYTLIEQSSFPVRNN